MGIELDPAAAAVADTWAERVLVGDIDRGGVWDQIDDESFDVVLCGDILEHLRDPLGALRSAVRKLKPDGYVVTSLPNVAHGDVRMLLLGGAFRYREVGLLDRTHLRFFTLETIRELLRDAGLLVVDTKRVVVPLFGTELEVERDGVPQATIDGILSDPEAETYQFVMKSVRDNGSQAVADLADRVATLTTRVGDRGPGPAPGVGTERRPERTGFQPPGPHRRVGRPRRGPRGDHRTPPSGVGRERAAVRSPTGHQVIPGPRATSPAVRRLQVGSPTHALGWELTAGRPSARATVRTNASGSP